MKDISKDLQMLRERIDKVMVNVEELREQSKTLRADIVNLNYEFLSLRIGVQNE